MKIGVHARTPDPLAAADAAGADAVQMFISDPQSWKKPEPRDDADALLGSDLAIFVHAPYPMNLVSPNNKIRIPSRKTLAHTVEAAAAIGAAGVIVHGGHVGDDEDLVVGFERWRKALDSFETSIPILIENTAGGGNAVVRELENYGPLWDALEGHDVGICLDTCHAWAGGADLEEAVAVISRVAESPSLVHCNDSRDPHNSRRDRHTNLGRGEIPEQLLVGVVREAAATTIVETPGEPADQAADVAWLRKRL